MTSRARGRLRLSLRCGHADDGGGGGPATDVRVGAAPVARKVTPETKKRARRPSLSVSAKCCQAPKFWTRYEVTAAFGCRSSL